MNPNGSLDPYLNPTPSPASQNFGAVDPYTFGFANEDGIVTNSKIVNLQANKITTGTLLATTHIDVGSISGGAYVRLDGATNRILINDGTTNRIVIGNI